MQKQSISDFVKRVYESGKLMNVSDAFEKYPVEDEWHKGNSDSYLEEPKEYFSIYDIGDIVFVKDFTYPNKTKGTDHLFVLIDKNNYAVPIENIGMIISSKIEKAKYRTNQLLQQNNVNGLKKDSIVKIDEVYQIANSQILFRVGTIDEDTVHLYKNSYDLISQSKNSIYE